MALVLTQVYLDSKQKEELAERAAAVGRDSSELVREAIDALLLGTNAEDLRRLDRASRQAQADLADMIGTLDANARAHEAFMKEMTRLRAHAS